MAPEEDNGQLRTTGSSRRGNTAGRDPGIPHVFGTRDRGTLKVTDSTGLTASTSIILQPNKTNVTLSSNQATSVVVDGITHTPMPYTIDTLIGFQDTVSVLASECVSGTLWNFVDWRDGGAAGPIVSLTPELDLTVTPGLDLFATYESGSGTC